MVVDGCPMGLAETSSHPMDDQDIILLSARGVYHRLVDAYTPSRQTPLADESFVDAAPAGAHAGTPAHLPKPALAALPSHLHHVHHEPL